MSGMGRRDNDGKRETAYRSRFESAQPRCRRAPRGPPANDRIEPITSELSRICDSDYDTPIHYIAVVGFCWPYPPCEPAFCHFCGSEFSWFSFMDFFEQMRGKRRCDAHDIGRQFWSGCMPVHLAPRTSCPVHSTSTVTICHREECFGLFH